MRLDFPGAFLQVSLLNPCCKNIENAPGSSSCIPSSFQAYLLNPSYKDIEMHLDFPGAFLQASLLNPCCKNIENAPGPSWCIPSNFLIKPLL